MSDACWQAFCLRITAADSPSRSMASGENGLPLAAYSCGYSQG
ncbi:hypothetical protein MGWOODY_XGa1327 [hydrothermal vent metagenome]|uniref:Uncharacterized protein n=1 Tax=hydrothermal vent metagenome TaxID=652676 RepID=A0A160TRU8_9ZZZZ